ncbi:MAG TPA: YidC/Oxa1 family insertase periplasmic-domain containing protein [Candidatus Acidoferrales bacterium]|nr:YidC/Oxa1 family insertase periplasmic-domain containing protein [Candidatus Acidoferrales bacterium]
MDRRTAIALALMMLVAVIFMAGRERFAPKPVVRPDTTHAAPAIGGPGASLTAAAPGAPAALPASGAAVASGRAAAPPVPERLSVVETPLYRATFSSRGARLVSFELKRYAAAYGDSGYAIHPKRRPPPGHEVDAPNRVELSGGPTFGVDLGSGVALRSLADAMFTPAESLDAAGAIRALTFTFQDTSGLFVRETWRAQPDTYLMDLELETRAVPAAWRISDYSLVVRSWPLMTETVLQNDLRGLRAVSLVGKDLHRDAAPGLVNKAPRVHEGVAHWAGVQSHYFLGLVAAASGDGHAALAEGFTRTLRPDQLALRPAGTPAVEPLAQGTLVMPLPASGAGTQRFVTYFGPSDYFALARQSRSLELERAVDLGFAWLVPISKVLLWLLRSINAVVRNFGISILVMATLVRLLLHPLNMSSMKSMRAMQRLQPETERIKEKFKNDAAAQNTAMMALYKENGVNPTGGCLPMVLQMPLLFSFYAVIFNAIDLRQAPFVGWIHDLSAPDVLLTVGPLPIRLLPVLMAGTGFLSQLFTPTDPRQAPTMYMMNFIMLIFFYNLPSGLVFYWTVMNLLTSLQQWLAMRSDGGVVVPAVVTPAKGRRR